MISLIPTIEILQLLRRSRASADSESAFVCPLCGRGYDSNRRRCTNCGSTLVVGINDADVYDGVVPMCGPRCDPERLRDETAVESTPKDQHD